MYNRKEKLAKTVSIVEAYERPHRHYYDPNMTPAKVSSVKRQFFMVTIGRVSIYYLKVK